MFIINQTKYSYIVNIVIYCYIIRRLKKIWNFFLSTKDQQTRHIVGVFALICHSWDNLLSKHRC